MKLTWYEAIRSYNINNKINDHNFDSDISNSQEMMKILIKMLFTIMIVLVAKLIIITLIVIQVIIIKETMKILLNSDKHDIDSNDNSIN